MSKKKGLLVGGGVNDAEYSVTKHTLVDGKIKRVWACPFYLKWKSMFIRCYSDKYKEKRPTYEECTVCEEWKTFSNFKAWMEHQEWKGKQLDKDLLNHGNKVYCPDYCVFVSEQVNSFVVESTAIRGAWPIGVYYEKQTNKFRAHCSNPFTKKNEHLGYFTCPNEAHQAWLKRKRELAHKLAALQTDPRVAKALIDRYNVEVYNPLHE